MIEKPEYFIVEIDGCEAQFYPSEAIVLNHVYLCDLSLKKLTMLGIVFKSIECFETMLSNLIL